MKVKSGKFVSSVVEKQEKLKLTRQRRIERLKARRVRMEAYFKQVMKTKKPQLQAQKFKDVDTSPKLQICEGDERPKVTNRSRIERFYARKRRMEMQKQKALVADVSEQTHKEVQELKKDVVEPLQEQVKKESTMWNNTLFYSFRDVERMSIADNLKRIAKSHSSGFFFQIEQPDVLGQYEMSFWSRM